MTYSALYIKKYILKNTFLLPFFSTIDLRWIAFHFVCNSEILFAKGERAPSVWLKKGWEKHFSYEVFSFFFFLTRPNSQISEKVSWVHGFVFYLSVLWTNRNRVYGRVHQRIQALYYLYGRERLIVIENEQNTYFSICKMITAFGLGTTILAWTAFHIFLSRISSEKSRIFSQLGL